MIMRYLTLIVVYLLYLLPLRCFKLSVSYSSISRMISSNNIIRQTNKYQTTNSHFDKFITTNANTHLVSTQVKSKKSLSNVARSFLTTSTVIFGSYITPSSATTVRKSDEFDVEIRTEFLGLSLAEIKKDDNILVTVQSIRDDADMMIKQVIRPGMILIAIGDNVVEGYSGKEVVNLFKSISKPTQLTFRDPVLFFDKLNTTKVYGTGVGMNTGSVGVGVRGGAIIDTTVNFATNETLRVQRLNPEDLVQSSRSANVGDVVEIEYSIRAMGRKDENKVGSVLVGTSGFYPLNEDKALYLMVGRPNDDLPTGFDLGLRGMSVGERRRVLLPPSLAYDSVKKFPLESGQIATVAKCQPLVVEVKLLSLNGLTTP